jgi:hypothetical protein
MKQQRKSRNAVMASVSPVIGAGLTIAGWVVVGNVAWQLVGGLTQSLLCEARSRQPLECLPAWTHLGEIGRRSTDTLLALVVHSPAESAAAAMGGMAGSVLINRRRKADESTEPLRGPIGIVPSMGGTHDESDDDPEPA